MVVDTTEEVVVGVFIVEDGVGGSRRRNAHTVNEEDSQRDCATPEGGGADDGRRLRPSRMRFSDKGLLFLSMCKRPSVVCEITCFYPAW